MTKEISTNTDTHDTAASPTPQRARRTRKVASKKAPRKRSRAAEDTADPESPPDAPALEAPADAAELDPAPQSETEPDAAIDALDAPPAPRHADEIFDDSLTFADLGLRNSVLKGVQAAGFSRPTRIQAQLIPAVLKGRDVLGQAKTGTGKTAAFGLPLFHRAYKELPAHSLILAPTRELAIQIAADLERLGRFTPIRVVAIYGGQKIEAQVKRLREGREIVVGTPGRVMDLHERGILPFKNIKHVVLDEVDRMLDIGFREDIRRILSRCPDDRQTVFVSATISPEIERLARSFMRDPEKIVTAAGSLTVSMVRQFYLPIRHFDKKRLLVHLLTHEDPALTVVFCRLKRMVDEVARTLQEKGIEAHAIHADLNQGRRNAVMQRLRSGRLSVLVASDLASRGLDVEGISHVVNFDLPEDPEVYVHRIGRTARAGRDGVAWSFVAPDQLPLLVSIERLIDRDIQLLEYPDFDPGPMPPALLDPEIRRSRIAPAAGRYTPPLPTTGRSQAPPDPAKFPGGAVPTKAPPRVLGGRVRTRGR